MSGQFVQYDLLTFLRRQRKFSESTFGPGRRTVGIVEHIKKELVEILDARETDAVLDEWIDVVILALDAAWREGYTPEEIARALEDKYERNMKRKWPDWRTKTRDEPIEHDRSVE
jgi:hypothetical protein